MKQKSVGICGCDNGQKNEWHIHFVVVRMWIPPANYYLNKIRNEMAGKKSTICRKKRKWTNWTLIPIQIDGKTISGNFSIPKHKIYCLNTRYSQTLHNEIHTKCLHAHDEHETMTQKLPPYARNFIWHSIALHHSYCISIYDLSYRSSSIIKYWNSIKKSIRSGWGIYFHEFQFMHVVNMYTKLSLSIINIFCQRKLNKWLSLVWVWLKTNIFDERGKRKTNTHIRQDAFSPYILWARRSLAICFHYMLYSSTRWFRIITFYIFTVHRMKTYCFILYHTIRRNL